MLGVIYCCTQNSADQTLQTFYLLYTLLNVSHLCRVQVSPARVWDGEGRKPSDNIGKAKRMSKRQDSRFAWYEPALGQVEAEESLTIVAVVIHQDNLLEQVSRGAVHG